MAQPAPTVPPQSAPAAGPPAPSGGGQKDQLRTKLKELKIDSFDLMDIMDAAPTEDDAKGWKLANLMADSFTRAHKKISGFVEQKEAQMRQEIEAEFRKSTAEEKAQLARQWEQEKTQLLEKFFQS